MWKLQPLDVGGELSPDEMKFDDVLHDVGEFGLYQKRLLLLISFTGGCVIMQNLSPVFTMKIPQHRSVYICLHVHLPVGLSANLFSCMSVCLSACLRAYLLVCGSIYMSSACLRIVCLHVCRSIGLPICLPVCMFVLMHICLPVGRSLCVPVCLTVCL